MREVLATMLIFLIGLCIFYLLDSDGYNKQLNEMKSHMGDTIIIRKDTLIIVDYDTWRSNYTLNNGVTISSTYLKLNKNNYTK